MGDNYITIAMPKGRIMEEALKIFKKTNIEIPEHFEDTRKLILTNKTSTLRWILAKPMDVPTYVEYGAADIGIVGKDVLMESERDVYELLDLRISPCRLSVAGLKDNQAKKMISKIASKYPRITEKYFREQGKQVEVIELHGSVELGPIIGLADLIVDIVSTGKTLKENGLEEFETIANVTTRLIANQVSYRTKQQEIKEIMDQLSAVI